MSVLNLGPVFIFSGRISPSLPQFMCALYCLSVSCTPLPSSSIMYRYFPPVPKTKASHSEVQCGSNERRRESWEGSHGQHLLSCPLDRKIKCSWQITLRLIHRTCTYVCLHCPFCMHTLTCIYLYMSNCYHSNIPRVDCFATAPISTMQNNRSETAGFVS